ncbi:ABC transporter permease [Olivibacter jilunii]|uniref:ABC transporter permease n=1 Tax=Olivibacter jilunii TaxID=985016 RepID=UPI0010303EF1|nr:ABC transporter permease [Olivibacter sp. LS-1]
MVIVLALLFTLAISWLSAILGLFVKSLEAAQWTGFVVIFPLTFASSAFVPTDTMPKALRFFAENQSLTHVINAMRAWLVVTIWKFDLVGVYLVHRYYCYSNACCNVDIQTSGELGYS